MTTTTRDHVPSTSNGEAELANNVLAAGAMCATLSLLTMAGPVVRVLPAVDPDGSTLPAIDVQLDYGAGPVPWKRLTISLSPDQHPDDD